MKQIIWLLAGVGLGFVVAHKVNQTESGRHFFDTLDQKARGFGEAVSDGYREREAEIRHIHDEN